MKRFLSLALALALSLSLAACGGGGEPAGSSSSQGSASVPAEQDNKTTLYVLGPVPDCGWTAQAGAYAQAKCEEITAAGQYKAVYMSASSGREQASQCDAIIANGDAAEVIMIALDGSAWSGQDALQAGGVPFISFGRVIETAERYAILNASGDNEQCGAGAAYWLQKNGMESGDVTVVLRGDGGAVCSSRQEGFERFLRGEIEYQDKLAGSFQTAETWTQEQLDALMNGYAEIRDWSADSAYSYLEQKLDKIVAAAKAGSGKLYICSMDDEMTLGLLNYLDSGASPATLADLDALDVYVASIGGMRELYDVMAGTSKQSDLAAQYFDDMMSMYFSPKMVQDVIETGMEYLAGNWDYATGVVGYLPTWIVDAANVSQFEGFQGH